MNLEKLTAPLWGAIGGAVILAVVGFTWGGWLTPGKAAKMSNDAAETAVVARLTSYCVEQHNRDADKATKHIAFMKLGVWERRDFVETQGWSKIPGDDLSDPNVAIKCAGAIAELES